MAKQGAKKVIKKQEKHLVAVLSTIFSLRMLGLCMLLPIFALEATNFKSANPQLIGLAIGIYGLAQAGLQIPFGWLSDRLGRKPIIILGLALVMLGSFIGMMATSIYGLIIGRILQGCGAIGSVVLATLTENIREQVRTQAMAILGAMIGLAFAFAIVLGPWLNQYIGLNGLFGIIGLLSLICISLVVYLPVQGHLPLPHNLTSKSINMQLIEINFGVFILHANLAALFLILPFILRSSGIIENKVWQLYLVVILCAMLVAYYYISKIQTKKNIKAPRFAILCLLLSEILLYTIHNWLGISAIMMVFFTGFCILEASLPALVAKHANANNRGAAMGWYSCLQFLGVFIGGGIGGWIHARLGISAVLSFCVILIVTWLLLNMLPRRTKFNLGSDASLVSDGISK